MEELRLLLEASGWTADFAGGQERTVSPDGLTAVIVSTGAGRWATRAARRAPRTEGPADAGRGDDQPGLRAGGVRAGSVPAPVTGRRCWVLLVKVEAERIDLELSVPDGMQDGLVVSWAERVPLPPLPRWATWWSRASSRSPWTCRSSRCVTPSRLRLARHRRG